MCRAVPVFADELDGVRVRVDVDSHLGHLYISFLIQMLLLIIVMVAILIIIVSMH